MKTLSQNWAAYFQRGAWRAEVIDRNAMPMNHGVSRSMRYMVKLVHPNGLNTDWPVRYDNGGVGYAIDAPARDAKRATEAAFKWIHTDNDDRTEYEEKN